MSILLPVLNGPSHSPSQHSCEAACPLNQLELVPSPLKVPPFPLKGSLGLRSLSANPHVLSHPVDHLSHNSEDRFQYQVAAGILDNT